MEDIELEFCKECGMEFPNSPKEACPSCGNKLKTKGGAIVLELSEDQIAESGKCVACLESLDEHDDPFWNYWIDFDSPEWLSWDYVWCVDCILKGIKKEYPDFNSALLGPDTYLAWKDALEEGIDLGPKLFDIDSSRAVRRLTDCAVFRGEPMTNWLNSDCPIEEAEQWPTFFDEFDDAMAWRNAGFKIGEDDVEGWLEWGCTAAIAAEFVNQGAEYAPRLDWKKFGIGISDAVYFQINDFSDSEEDGPYIFIGTWSSSGFSPSKIVELRDEINEVEHEFESLHEANRSRVKLGNWTYDFWGWLPRMFEDLKSVGLPINVENLKKYWGLSSKEILKVIDAGGKPGVAADVMRRGGSVSKLGLIEKLLGLGLLESSAILLSKRGFLLKHIKQIDESKDVRSTVQRLAEFLNEDAGMKIEDAFTWLDVPYATPKQAKLWRLHGFSGEEAGKWLKEGFNVAEVAKRWRDSGVNSPVTAKRRRDAGLNP